MANRSRYSPEVRLRAVRMVLEHEGEHDSQWATIRSIASKIGCSFGTLRNWVRQTERDQARRPGLTSHERNRFKELGRANEIVRKTSAFFAPAESAFFDEIRHGLTFS